MTSRPFRFVATVLIAFFIVCSTPVVARCVPTLRLLGPEEVPPAPPDHISMCGENASWKLKRYIGTEVTLKNVRTFVGENVVKMKEVKFLIDGDHKKPAAKFLTAMVPNNGAPERFRDTIALIPTKECR